MPDRRLVFAIATAALLASGAEAAPMDLPLRTWVAIPAARTVGGEPQGACTDGGCKHTRITFNPGNNRTYWLGGDYGPHSGVNYLWSYSVRDNSWRLETPMCVPPGQVQPSGPDEIGFAYDRRRDLFWMIPGFQWDHTAECPNSTLLRGKSMSFSVATGLWADANKPAWDAVYSGLQVFSQYDVVTDAVIMFSSYSAYHYRTDGSAERVPFGVDSNGVDNGNAYIWDEYTAFDETNRIIYAIDPGNAKIYGYYIDRRELRYLGPAPAGSQYDQSMPLWDSLNRVVLWPQVLPLDGSGNAVPIRFHVYHPDTNTWETNLPVNAPVDLLGNVVRDANGNTIPVLGRVSVYDPSENVLILTGVNAANPVPYLFLYRYGNGAGGAPGDSIAPSAPQNLRTR